MCSGRRRTCWKMDQHQELRQALEAALQDLCLMLCVEADGPFVRESYHRHEGCRTPEPFSSGPFLAPPSLPVIG
jgi:hypothetical protein